MRVTGGTGRGRRLRVPAGDRVRPTSDKVKQALFNILGTKVRGSAFLDLFAGTGGIGIEALSRGAGRVVFIDDARRSLEVVRHNLDQSGFGAQAQVIASKAESYLRKTDDRFDIVFLDPPYTTGIAPLLELIAGLELLAPDAVVVAEHFKKQPSPERAGTLTLYREAVYGDTVLAFYRVNGIKETGGIH
jgi:16S rRNA (guanine(966)-N(2))-methyltransferase RsmD